MDKGLEDLSNYQGNNDFIKTALHLAGLLTRQTRL